MATGALIAGPLAAAQTNQTVERTVGRLLGGSGIKPVVKDVLRGPCRADLSIESIILKKSGPTGPLSINIVIKNVGSEAFNAPPRFTGAVIQTTNGASEAVTRRDVANIALIRPGESRRFATTLRRSVFDEVEFGGEVLAYLNFGPDAPRCGVDPNPDNDSLSVSNDQVREWLGGEEREVVIQR